MILIVRGRGFSGDLARVIDAGTRTGVTIEGTEVAHARIGRRYQDGFGTVVLGDAGVPGNLAEVIDAGTTTVGVTTESPKVNHLGIGRGYQKRVWVDGINTGAGSRRCPRNLAVVI